MAETNGAIYGIVSEEGVVKVGNEVVLLDHATLSVIAKTVTDQYGGYMFNNLDPDKKDYMLFTVDNDGVEPKNALIKDYVQPVTTANGVQEGNFVGVLDSLAPTMSAIPVYRPGETSVKYKIARPHGGAHAIGQHTDWNSISGVTSTEEDPPASACPVPTNRVIRGMVMSNAWAGWVNRPNRFEMFDKQIATVDMEEPEITAKAPFTMFITHLTTGNALTYSLCYGVRPNDDRSLSNTRHSVDVFYPDSNPCYTPDCFFNVCVEANGELRLKWLTDNGGVPTAASKKNELVAVLSPDKWYAITVRVGDYTQPTAVDLCDVYAGVTTSYSMPPLGSLNQQKGYGAGYGWNTYGVPRRRGFRISGAHNQAVNNTFNSWDTNKCWSWKAFVPATGTAGPWACWNRSLDDAEVALLLRAMYDTTPYRAVPRVISEIMKHVPHLYVPMDEPVGLKPRITRLGQRVPLYVLGGQTSVEPPGALSVRRRKVMQLGEGLRVQPVGIPHQHSITLVAFMYQPVEDGSGVLFNQVQHGDTTQNYDNTGSNIYHDIYAAVLPGGVPRLYWRDNADAYHDDRFGTQSALKEPGHHMLAFVMDVYYGLKVTAYVDGEPVGVVASTQRSVDCHYTGINVEYYIHGALVLGAEPQVNGYPNGSRGAFGLTGVGIVRSPMVLTDFVSFSGCLDAAAIKELYDAYAVAIGPDSHE